VKLAIVTTSINPRPQVYGFWANVGHLIVAGDQNSPPELESYVKGLGGTYLSPEEQNANFSFSSLIGWSNIQRRNAAIMRAYAAGCEYILTVDDDNVPLPDAETFARRMMHNIDPTADHVIVDDTVSLIGSHTGFLNTGDLCSPRFHQRGVPYGMGTTPVVFYDCPRPTVVVSQAQVLGDPDCDAVERMTAAPNVIAVNANAIIAPGTYSAFNSQATMWRRDWAPVMAVLPHIGRFDDIFASFMFARLSRSYNTAYFVGEPVMRQDRNPHNLVKDLEAEVWGMRNSFTFCGALNNAHIDSSMPLWQAYSELAFAVRHILPTKTGEFMSAWVDEWRRYL
jgi:hypothetical protein